MIRDPRHTHLHDADLELDLVGAELPEDIGDAVGVVDAKPARTSKPMVSLQARILQALHLDDSAEGRDQ